MKISPIASQMNSIGLNGTSINKVKEDDSFSNMLNDAIKEVNKEQSEAYSAMKGIATGRVDNLQKAVQQIEEAELSLKLALEVKNKSVMGFKQITQMQI